MTLRSASILLLLAGALRGHEIGTTRVSVLLGDEGTYDIRIVTDAVALVEKIEASTGLDPQVDPNPATLEAKLHGFDDHFRRRFRASFDSVDVRPDISYAVAARADVAAPPLATIRLRGQIPEGARDFSWTYSWTFTSYAFTVRRAGAETPVTEWLEGGRTSPPIPLESPAPVTDRLTIAWKYLTLGFTHILPFGLDHVLFVLGIYLLSGNARSVLIQVSAFTVAHTITLGLSIYGVIAAPPAIVEPLIAVSIAYVAIENIFLSELRSWRVGLVFGFGLLHGMGFAGVLSELGLPRSEFLTALVTFNLGVEAGQLAVIAAAFFLVGWQFANRAWYRSRVVVPLSAVIACTALYWTVERLSS